MYVIVDSVIDVNNIITGSINITLRKVTVKPFGYDKMYMNKGLIGDKLYQLVDQLNERKVNRRNFLQWKWENFLYVVC